MVMMCSISDLYPGYSPYLPTCTLGTAHTYLPVPWVQPVPAYLYPICTARTYLPTCTLLQSLPVMMCSISDLLPGYSRSSWYRLCVRACTNNFPFLQQKKMLLLVRLIFFDFIFILIKYTNIQFLIVQRNSFYSHSLLFYVMLPLKTLFF